MMKRMTMCSSRQNPYPPYHPMEGHKKFLGGGGILKAKILETKYEAKLEFHGEKGGGMQNKKLSMG